MHAVPRILVLAERARELLAKSVQALMVDIVVAWTAWANSAAEGQGPTDVGEQDMPSIVDLVQDDEVDWAVCEEEADNEQEDLDCWEISSCDNDIAGDGGGTIQEVVSTSSVEPVEINDDGSEDDLSYIKLYNYGGKVVTNRMHGYLRMRIAQVPPPRRSLSPQPRAPRLQPRAPRSRAAL